MIARISISGFWGTVLLLTFILAGCNNIGALPLPSPTVPLQFKTHSATLKPTPTLTPTPTFAYTAIPTPTPVPPQASSALGKAIPTLPQARMASVVASLSRSGSGCQLPCWWGLVPGQTGLNDALMFLLQFDSYPYSPSKSNRAQTFHAAIPVPMRLSQTGTVRLALTFDQNMLQGITVSDYAKPDYQISAILNSYGPPDEVWLHIVQPYHKPHPPFIILLFYRRLGILVKYTAGHFDTFYRGNIIEGCFTTTPVVYLWPGGTKDSIQEIQQHFNLGLPPEYPLKSLQDTASLDVARFYQLYRNPEHSPCLSTVKTLWTEP